MRMYAIFLSGTGRDTPEEAVKAHRDFLLEKHESGQVVMAGRLDNQQGLIVVKADSKEEAEALIQTDPFVSEGYRNYEVCEWTLTVH